MSLPVVLGAAVFGGSASAFLPRVAHRLAVPSGAPPRSSCADCGTAFPPGPDGWVRAGPSCRRRISTPRPDRPAFRRRVSTLRPDRPACRRVPWRTIAAGSAASGLLGATVGAVPLLPVLLLAAVLGVLLAVIDLRCLRLPNPLVAALALLTGFPVGLLGEPGQVARGALAAAMSYFAYAMIALWPRGGLGFGDVKLAAALGLVLGFLGWPVLLLGLALPHLINGPIALFLLARGRIGRRSAVPLGPALLTGALLAVALGG